MRLPNDVVIPEKPVRLGEPIESWYLCPVCRMKLFKMIPGAKAQGIIIKCKKCRNNINVSL